MFMPVNVNGWPFSWSCVPTAGHERIGRRWRRRRRLGTTALEPAAAPVPTAFIAANVNAYVSRSPKSVNVTELVVLLT